ncbi:1,4-beta-xylanase [Bifidobacterium lemurum]|uniref:1,4-beta-xylanase n=1 Tax=Bifidobacterium lemurum TaxID=1603886 RepID=A0A261FSK2_9BIFI|nr:glycoside hydrolase family 43 protein [Bifidobacterium lemurum]OZG62048.1 1,4-beta-xylanase [Bifidobacterium lemurum]
MNTRNDEKYGYLMVHFREDPHGYAERIYLDRSDGDDPRRWIPLNGGEPVLTSDIGTTGVRDPHIIRNPETGVWYIIATDLRVFGGLDAEEGNDNWGYWSHHGSTDLIIWESDDLLHWRGPRTLDVSRRADGSRMELGMAWACECLWVPDYYDEDRAAGHDGGRGAFVMYWSSRPFADDDPGHTDPDSHDTVLWGATRDFTNETYEYGGVFIDTGGNSIDTTMIQRPLPDGGTRTYRITKDNSHGNGIWMDRTDAKRWWERGAEWTTVQTRIGAEYAGGEPGGVEGPAVFANHHNDGGAGDEWYLLVDVIPSIGYRPMVTNDLDAGWRLLDDPDFALAEHTKHGGVVSLTRAEYDRLAR